MKVRSSNWLAEGGAAVSVPRGAIGADAVVIAAASLAVGVDDSPPAIGDGDSYGCRNVAGARTASTRAVAVCQNGDGVSVGADADESDSPTSPCVIVHADKSTVEAMRSGRPVSK